MWTPGHGPDLRGVHRPTCPIGVDDVDERRFNPLCRRDSDTDPDPDDSDDDDDDDSDSSGCDLVENAHRARLNDLRRLDRDREEIRRQNETLEHIRVARCEQRHMAEELASMRFEAERRHTLAWGDDTDVKRRERAAERAAEAIGDAMDEEELGRVNPGGSIVIPERGRRGGAGLGGSRARVGGVRDVGTRRRASQGDRRAVAPGRPVPGRRRRRPRRDAGQFSQARAHRNRLSST